MGLPEVAEKVHDVDSDLWLLLVAWMGSRLDGPQAPPAAPILWTLVGLLAVTAGRGIVAVGRRMPDSPPLEPTDPSLSSQPGDERAPTQG